MGISRVNSEGYYDPTAHEAVCNIEKEARRWRPLVYICSPYSGDVDRNTEKARRYCRFAVDQGAIPLAAHLLLPQFMSETRERESNDWLGQFLEDRCEVDKMNFEKSGELYQQYRFYCMSNGEYVRSTSDFYGALDKAGFIRRKTNKGSMVQGLKLKEGQDFLE